MKKSLLSVLLILIMVTLLAACSSEENKEDKMTYFENEVNKEETNADDEMESEDENAIVNADGVKFDVDTTVTGEIKKDAGSISSDKIVIEGKTYSIPFKVSELHANGWKLPEGFTFNQNVEPNTKATLAQYRVYNDANMGIDIASVLNNTTKELSIQDCIVTRLNIEGGFVSEDFECVLPGGITYHSTAADVISVFGDPNNAPSFVTSHSSAAQLSYERHKDTNISYSFVFKTDGTINGIYISYEE